MELTAIRSLDRDGTHRNQLALYRSVAEVDCMKVYTIGSAFEETPEGLYIMDRLRESEEEILRSLTKKELEFYDATNRKIDEGVFFGG